MQYGTHRSACEETMLPGGCLVAQRLGTQRWESAGGSERAIPARFLYLSDAGSYEPCFGPTNPGCGDEKPAHCQLN